VITNFVLESNGRFINTGDLSNPYDGVFFRADASEISASDPLTTGKSLIDLGLVLAPNLDETDLLSLFNASTYVGSLGSGVQNFDIVFSSVPEPTSAILLIGLTLPMMVCRRRVGGY
jgi:hypothetical protein